MSRLHKKVLLFFYGFSSLLLFSEQNRRCVSHNFINNTFYIDFAIVGKICVSIFMIIVRYAMALSSENFSVKNSILRISKLFIYTFVVLVLFTSLTEWYLLNLNSLFTIFQKIFFGFLFTIIIFSNLNLKLIIYKLTEIITASLLLYAFMKEHISIISPIDVTNNIDYNIHNFLFVYLF